jgi:CubicO group peptidase (beta-lactamase class C family)
MFDEILREGAKDRVFSNASLGVLNNGEWDFFNYGFEFDSDLKPSTTKITEESIFDCASVTKTFPTGILALHFIDQNKIGLEDPVVKWIPELSMKEASKITLKHLLTHTLDYSFSLASMKLNTPQEIWKKLTSWEFPIPPGESYLYCNSTSVLLGVLLERIGGASLSELTQQYLLNEMDLKKTGFNPLESNALQKIVPTENDSWRGRVIRGEVHDESASVLKEVCCPGSAGLFSCTNELSKIVDELLLADQGGSKWFSKELFNNALENYSPVKNVEVALGFERNQTRFMGEFKGFNVVGKTGFTGATLVFSPEISKAYVLLCNYTWPQRKVNSQQMNDFRSKISNQLWDLPR